MCDAGPRRLVQTRGRPAAASAFRLGRQDALDEAARALNPFERRVPAHTRTHPPSNILLLLLVVLGVLRGSHHSSTFVSCDCSSCVCASPMWPCADVSTRRRADVPTCPRGHKVRDVAWAPNTATPASIVASCSEDGGVVIWTQPAEGADWSAAPLTVRSCTRRSAPAARTSSCRQALCARCGTACFRLILRASA